MGSHFYVYGLIDPRDSILKYIGITHNIQRRYKDHLSKTQSNNRKNAWIKKLIKLNLQPQLVILFTYDNIEAAEIKEIELIKLYGKKQLLNEADGGKTNRGYKLSHQTKKKMAKNRKGVKNGFYGKTHTTQIRSNVSKAQSIAIIDSLGREYGSITEAAKLLSLHITNISGVISGKRKTTGKLKFFLKKI